MKNWTGPYAPKDRHADSVTIDHIIDLRKRVALLEKQLENVLSWVNTMRAENEQLKRILKENEKTAPAVVVPQKSRVKRTYWINLYNMPMGESRVYLRHETAMENRSDGWIGCAKIKIDIEEGEQQV